MFKISDENVLSSKQDLFDEIRNTIEFKKQCIYCSKQFESKQRVKSHMKFVGHCQINIKFNDESNQSIKWNCYKSLYEGTKINNIVEKKQKKKKKCRKKKKEESYYQYKRKKYYILVYFTYYIVWFLYLLWFICFVLCFNFDSFEFFHCFLFI